MTGLRSSVKYSLAFKLQVLNEVRKGVQSNEQIRKKYGIKGHSTIYKWMRIFEDKRYSMKTVDKDEHVRRIWELEQQLEEERLRRIAAETTIAVAEQELKISIRKKSDSKQSKL